jgi:hypothetical protein
VGGNLTRRREGTGVTHIVPSGKRSRPSGTVSAQSLLERGIGHAVHTTNGSTFLCELFKTQ